MSALAAIRRVVDRVSTDSAGRVWTPLPGPQTAAYYSPADITGYGGAPGGGKTDLGLGLASTAHRHSIIFRRVFPSVRGIIERSRELFTQPGNRLNEGLHIWRLADGRLIEFASIQYDHDKSDYQGRPHDLYVFDELTEFTEAQFTFVIGWNRSTYVDPLTRLPQRARVLATFNPPLTEEGEWVTRYFGAWLDDEHPHPAKDGELRWYGSIDGKDTEIDEADLAWYIIEGGAHLPVDSGAPVERNGQWAIPVRGLMHGDEFILVRSRTFFHATLKDNPILEATGYAATIDTLPEPIRSILKGLKVTKASDPWQTIPYEWVKMAQARWETTPQPEVALRCVGNDIAHGGADNTVLAPLYGVWFGKLLVYPGTITPRGEDAANYALKLAGHKTAIFADGIGYGASAVDTMQSWGMKARAINFGAATEATDRSGKFRFANIRAEAYWKFREALDPASGEDICLPPDREVLIDLCAPKFKIVAGRIHIEPKDDVKKRIGRSPDWGDAIVLAWYGARRSGGLRVEQW